MATQRGSIKNCSSNVSPTPYKIFHTVHTTERGRGSPQSSPNTQTRSEPTQNRLTQRLWTERRQILGAKGSKKELKAVFPPMDAYLIAKRNIGLSKNLKLPNFPSFQIQSVRLVPPSSYPADGNHADEINPMPSPNAISSSHHFLHHFYASSSLPTTLDFIFKFH